MPLTIKLKYFYKNNFNSITFVLGTCLSPLLMVVFSYFDNVNPWYFLISLIPQIISGGTITYLAITLAYISDISTPETRGIR